MVKALIGGLPRLLRVGGVQVENKRKPGRPFRLLVDAHVHLRQLAKALEKRRQLLLVGTEGQVLYQQPPRGFRG